MVDSPEYGDRPGSGKTGAWLVLTALLVAAGCQPIPPPAPPPPMAADLWADLSYLGDPARQGRQLGSDGRDSAAAYIARGFRDAGLRPVPEPDCAWEAVCESSYSWRFPVRLIRDPATGINVAGMVSGTDTVLSDEFVVVGAHYDHIGRLRALSRDPRASGIRPGADDNASGTAGMLELARRVARDPLPRTVLFVAFDAEEIGLYGSEAFVDHPPVPLHRIVAMLNLDMVGRLSRSRLTVAGVGSDDRFRPMLERLNAAGPKLDLTLRGSGSGSDHVSFLQASVPALHFFTGLHADYHTRSDRVEKINVPGMLRVLELAEGVLRELASAVGYAPGPIPPEEGPAASGSRTAATLLSRAAPGEPAVGRLSALP